MIYDEDSDNLKIIPLTKIGRLFNRAPSEFLKEFAGRQIKYITVVVHLENRKPVSISDMKFHLMKIDQNGKFDAAFLNELNMAAAKLITLPTFELPNNVIDKSSDFAQKQFKHQYTWTPSSAIENKVRKIIFG